MRVAIFSDIHGNIRGFDACLADLAEQGGADRIVGAGDFCLYGPRPRDVVDRLSAIGAACIRGNTDRFIAQNVSNDDDPRTLAWTAEQLGSERVAWLGALPFSLSIGDGPDALLVVHATPQDDDVHIWPDADDAFLERVTEGVVERTIAFGHLHLPYVRLWRDRLFVNVASAGLPKDGDPRACYAILTQRPGGWEVKHRRVAFNVEKVARDIRQCGMPKAKAQIEILLRHRYKQLGDVIP